MLDDGVQVQIFGVDQFGGRLAVRKDVCVEVTAWVEDHLGLGEHPGGTHRQQIRGAGAGADEVHGTRRGRGYLVVHWAAV